MRMSTTSDSVALMIEGLTKSYGRVRALRGVDLSVQRGEIVGFLGPNGAGKTTTIRCLLDLIRPDSGSVRVLGMDPQVDSVKVRARSGYLPGELQLDPNLTAEGVLRYFGSLRSNNADWSWVRQLASRLDLDLRPRIRNLSHGNKQKIGVVQALMHRPELLLLDEPTLGLDPLIQQEVYRLLTEVRAEGSTVFFSSHIISEVEALADRVAIIRKGVIVEEAEPDRLLRMAMRRMWIRFGHAIDPTALERLEGVTVLSKGDGHSVHLQVAGEVGPLIKALSSYPVSDFDMERPSLEEVFLAYYEVGD